MEEMEEKKETTQQPKNKPTGWQVVLDYMKDIVYMVAAFVLIFTFCVRLVQVSGRSMYNTLFDGDRLLLVDESFCGELEQGDIVVAAMERFRGGSPIVKRVIATEGQTVDIDFDAGIVYVDGVALEEDYTFTPTNHQEGMTFPLVVNEGCLFLMGDNRNESLDSRSMEIGQVDQREILGKAILLYWPGTHYGYEELDLSRIGGMGQ